MNNEDRLRDVARDIAKQLSIYQAVTKDMKRALRRLDEEFGYNPTTESKNQTRTVRLFLRHPVWYMKNKIQLWWKACVIPTEWYQEGNKITLKIQRCGFFRRYCGIPFVTTIEIDPAQVIQPTESHRECFFT